MLSSHPPTHTPLSLSSLHTSFLCSYIWQINKNMTSVLLFFAPAFLANDFARWCFIACRKLEHPAIFLCWRQPYTQGRYIYRRRLHSTMVRSLKSSVCVCVIMSAVCSFNHFVMCWFAYIFYMKILFCAFYPRYCDFIRYLLLSLLFFFASITFGIINGKQ